MVIVSPFAFQLGAINPPLLSCNHRRGRFSVPTADLSAPGRRPKHAHPPNKPPMDKCHHRSHGAPMPCGMRVHSWHGTVGPDRRPNHAPSTNAPAYHIVWMLHNQGNASSNPGSCLRCKRADKSAVGAINRPLRLVTPILLDLFTKAIVWGRIDETQTEDSKYATWHVNGTSEVLACRGSIQCTRVAAHMVRGEPAHALSTQRLKRIRFLVTSGCSTGGF